MLVCALELHEATNKAQGEEETRKDKMNGSIKELVKGGNMIRKRHKTKDRYQRIPVSPSLVRTKPGHTAEPH